MFEKSNVSSTADYVENDIAYRRIESEMRNLAGKVLTLIDATFGDYEQKKALKDLIKQDFSRTIFTFQDIAWEGKKGHGVLWESDIDQKQPI